MTAHPARGASAAPQRITLRRGPRTARFAVADLTTEEGVATFRGLVSEALQPVSLVYSDPPWSPGNEKWWRRHAKLAPPEDYTRLLSGWSRAVQACDAEHVFVEQSINAEHRRMFTRVAERTPGWALPLLESWEVLYGSPKRPNVLLHYGRTPLNADPSGLSGEPMTRLVFDALALPAGSLVADPCMGLGMTARMAVEHDLDVLGTELNPTRLGRTVAWLQRQGYVEEGPQLMLPVAPPPPSTHATLVSAITALASLPEAERVAAYNAAQRALGALVADLAPDPACAPQLVPVERIDANDYNPNRVASPELSLLEGSMRADGITMAVVTMADEASGRWTVIDGFHRRTVAAERLGRRYLPCAVIDRPLADRMASTVRHNRARGKHQVDLMAALVRGMLAEGWEDQRIATALGMSPEEYLRLCQMVGVAKLLAGERYSRAWGAIEPPAQSEGEEP